MTYAEYEISVNIVVCMQFAMAWLVWPPAFASFVLLGYRSYRKKQIIESLPFLASQLNTAFIWVCLASYTTGVFNLYTNGNRILNGKNYGLKDFVIQQFLLQAIKLEPLNIFLYTWRFLKILEVEEENNILRHAYRWFARFTIVVVPLMFIAVLLAYVYYGAQEAYYTVHFNIIQAQFYGLKAIKFSNAISYLTVICNIMSCVLMVLVLRVLKHISNKMRQTDSNVTRDIEINSLVTFAHVFLVLSYTTISIFLFNVPSTNGLGS